MDEWKSNAELVKSYMEMEAKRVSEAASCPGDSFRRALAFPIIETFTPDTDIAYQGRKLGLSFVSNTNIWLDKELADTYFKTLRLEELDSGLRWFTGHLLQGTWPLYTLEELADITLECISYLEKNRKHILTTGFPSTGFVACPWLQDLLGTQYYFKMPAYVRFKGSTEPGSIEYEYEWPLQPAESLPDHGYYPVVSRRAGTGLRFWYSSELRAYTNHGQLIQCVSYEDAALMHLFPSGRYEQIHSMRDRLFELSISILHRLHKAVSRERIDGLLDDCIDSLTDPSCKHHLSKDEFEFCIRMDEFYASNAFGRVFLGPWGAGAHGAVLSNLLRLIGYYQTEITHKTNSSVRSILGRVLEFDSIHGFRLSLEHLRPVARDLLPAAQGVLSSLRDSEENCWEAYSEKLREALETRLRVKILGVEVTKQHYPMIAKHITPLIKTADLSLELWGELPRVINTQSLQPVAIPKYVFRSGTDKWTIAYQGCVEFYLTGSKGLAYIQVLLGNPHKTYTCTELVRQVSGIPLLTPNEEYADMSVEELLEESLAKDNPSAQQILDGEVYRDIRKRLVDLSHRRKLAEIRDDHAKAKRLSEDMNQLSKYLSSTTNKLGEPRHFTTMMEKDRTSVQKCINRALGKIKQECPPLYEHLQGSIDTGTEVSYNPSTPINWQF